MIFKDYYKILGFDTNRVSLDQIKIGFREQAKKYHPDLNEGSGKAEARFKDINEAYRILSNQATRKKYDRSWNANIGRRKNREQNAKNINHSDNLFDEIKNMIFGAKKEEPKEKKVKSKSKPAIKGENIETAINVSIEEAFFGASKKISLRTTEGKMRSFTVKIPAGIRDGEKIRLLGQGKNGENGGKSGDLLIQITIENNKKYRLEGCDIYTELKIAPWESVLGARVSVEGIDDTETIYLQKGIQSGDKIKIQGKGYKDGKGGRGALVAEIQIIVPKNPSEEEIKLYEKLKELSKSLN